MEKELLILKPNIVNALLPLFIRNLFYSFVIVLLLYGVSFILRFFNIISYSVAVIVSWLFVLLIVLAAVPLLYQIIVLANTRYYFFKTHVISEIEMIYIERHSVNYSQITNIATKISLWDRLSNAGDITLHTGQEQTPSLILSYIKDPHRIEKAIYHLIHKNKN